ncbi:MAG: PIG-L family deacetylase [Actinomycetota bacterium]|nr:PIG-L family deacetylase [Actinomycetota bacterium]
MTSAQNPLTPEPISLGRWTSNLETPARALAIGAHPDDVDFGCGATLAKWATAGCEVSVLVCTDGSKGTWDPTTDETQLIATRKVEQQAAAERLGATGNVVFLGYTDGELESGLVQRARVSEWIRRLRPTVVLGHDPWKRYRLHPDHRHAGLLTTEGVVAARDPKFFPDQLAPSTGLAHHRPDTILLWEADEPDHVEDVTGYAETKFAALLAHQSQFESTMKATSDAQMEAFRERMVAKLVAGGRAASFEHAEVFKLLDDL